MGGSPLYLVAAILAVLGLFSTNVPVYDGERLFLLVFPLWALLIGDGFARIWDHLSGSRGRGVLVAFLLLQGYGVVAFHPFGTSYYNLLVGGLRGADRLGLERAYWSEAVDRTLLARLAREAAPGESAALAPTLAPDQGKVVTGRDLARRKLILGDEPEADRADWLVVSYRTAYWSEATRRFVAEGEVVAVRSRQGVPLAALVRRKRGGTPGHPAGNL